MRAVAILGPGISRADLRLFQFPDVEVATLEEAGGFEKADAVLVLGGDGTIHRHLAALSACQVPVLMVPRGSGNDFARALGLLGGRRAPLAWANFHTGISNVRSIDVGLITSLDGERKQTHFCCVGGAGLDAEANRRANALPRFLRGRGGYVLSVVRAMAAYQPQRITVFAAPSDAQQSAPLAERFSEPTMFVAFANAPSYGGGMRIAPQAQLHDGKLDVCCVRQTARLRLLKSFPRVFSGRHLEMPEVEYFQTARLRLETETPLDVYADGEYVCRTPVEVSVVPKALRVIVP